MPNRMWFTSLTQHLVESLDQSGEMNLPTGMRYRAEQCLEHALVNPQVLHDHIGVLFMLFSPNSVDEFDHEILTQSQRDNVLANGLRALSDQELAALIVNPVALMSFAHDIERFASAKWLEVVEREVQCEVRKKRRKHKHLQQLLNEGFFHNERESVCGSQLKMDGKETSASPTER
jgi:hypothetical protein